MKPPKDLVKINNTEDLKKILLAQQVITTQAKVELLRVASETEMETLGLSLISLPNSPTIDFRAQEFVDAEKLLLEKYAKYPTLTEYALMPHLYDLVKWGATFGVTLIVGELIIEQVRSLRPVFKTLPRRLYRVLLSEMNNPTHKYLIDCLTEYLDFNFLKPDGTTLSTEEKLKFRTSFLKDIVEAFLIVSLQYGVVEISEERGYFLTDIGRRVLLHLLDSEKFVLQMTEVQKRFKLQEEEK